MKSNEESQADADAKQNEDESEERPNKGMEDWEFAQEREETPLKVPYWFPIAVGALILGGILLTLPWLGIRKGYERPWLDWGLLIGAGYGVVFLGMIYFFMKTRKNQSGDAEESEEKKRSEASNSDQTK